tara:strand:+ start:412 stop:843 length:432 start_codon:yes stop_codon:yes gene_type:complete
MNINNYNTAKNNIHSHFPALMEDGNLYTNWNSVSLTNDMLKNKSSQRDNYQYRQWLVSNAESVMKQNQVNAFADSCTNNNMFKKVANSSKYIFRNCNDKVTPPGYETSDLKDVYLSKQELQERLTAPIMTQEELLKNGFINYF